MGDKQLASRVRPGAETPYGHLPFLIRRDGTWLYRGSPIERRELVCLFSSVLKRDDAGVYLLETPAERGAIEVEDTPWLAVELDWSGCGRDQVLSFRTNVDQILVAGDDHPIRVVEHFGGCHPRPYIHARGTIGPTALEARIARPVFYELVALAVPGSAGGRDCLGVWSCGRFFPIGALPPPEEL